MKLRIIHILILVSLTAALRLPFLNLPLERDEGEYAYVFSFQFSEVMPFRDSTNHRGPVLFFIYKVIFHFLGGTPRDIHGFLAFYVILEILALYGLGLVLCNSPNAAFWAGLTFSLLTFKPLTGLGTAANLEIFMVLFIIFGVLSVFLGLKKARLEFFLAGGFFLGTAAMTNRPPFWSAL